MRGDPRCAPRGRSLGRHRPEGDRRPAGSRSPPQRASRRPPSRRSNRRLRRDRCEERAIPIALAAANRHSKGRRTGREVRDPPPQDSGSAVHPCLRPRAAAGPRPPHDRHQPMRWARIHDGGRDPTTSTRRRGSEQQHQPRRQSPRGPDEWSALSALALHRRVHAAMSFFSVRPSSSSTLAFAATPLRRISEHPAGHFAQGDCTVHGRGGGDGVLRAGRERRERRRPPRLPLARPPEARSPGWPIRPTRSTTGSLCICISDTTAAPPARLRAQLRTRSARWSPRPDASRAAGARPPLRSRQTPAAVATAVGQDGFAKRLTAPSPASRASRARRGVGAGNAMARSSLPRPTPHAPTPAVSARRSPSCTGTSSWRSLVRGTTRTKPPSW